MATDLKVASETDVGVGEYQYGFHDPTDKYVFTARKGIDRDIVSQILNLKNEPERTREFRLNAREIIFKKPLPTWGGELRHLDFQDIHNYDRASANQDKRWYTVPEAIRNTYDLWGFLKPKRSICGRGGTRIGSRLWQPPG